MTMPSETSPPTLAVLRQEIDRIDGAMHDLLMARARVVLEVAEAKRREGVAEPGAKTYRPAREAQVLRTLATRHNGELPLSTVFRLWREIISSSITGKDALQSAYRIALYPGDETLAFWDLARDQFGSAAQIDMMPSAREALSRVDTGERVIGILPLPGNYADGRWWTALWGVSGPRVLGRLPFLAGGERVPQALVVGKADYEPSGDDTTLIAVRLQSGMGEAQAVRLARSLGIDSDVLAVDRPENDASTTLLLGIQTHLTSDDARVHALDKADGIGSAVVVGGYPNPVTQSVASDGGRHAG